jgi:methanogenic corrinoid protein MtbC1
VQNLELLLALLRAGVVHDIGKSIVGALWAASGYQVVDLGYDAVSKTFVN